MKNITISIKNIKLFMIFGNTSKKDRSLSIKYGRSSMNYGKASVKHGKFSIEINRLSGHPTVASAKEIIASERNKEQPVIVK